MVIGRRDRDRCGVNVKVGRKQLIDGCEDRNGEFGSRIRGAGGFRLNPGDQSDSLAGSFEFAIDTKVIAAECAGAYNGNAEIAFAGYCYAPLPSTAFKQRV
jgi:hypothetical protein